jgi:LL-diaminopimelate aminotransferase
VRGEEILKFKSKVVSNIPPHIFMEIGRMKQEMISRGIDVIDLGIGDPDLPTPEHIVNKLKEELLDQSNFKYPNFSGCVEYRQAVADYYKREYQVDLNPETEVIALVGSKEGIAHLAPAICDPEDIILIPNPGYAIYQRAAVMASASTYMMPLTEENDFRPNYDVIPAEITSQAALMYLNYPNNPTSAAVDLDFYKNTVDFAKRHQIVVATDAAYQQVTFNGYKAPSILQVEGSKELAVEFGSLSKTYCMTGWRIGYAVGNKEVLRSMMALKSNVDSCQFTPIQKAAAFALNSDQSCVVNYNAIYEKRLDVMLQGLKSIGIDAPMPKGGFFIWAPVPGGYTSESFFKTVLEQTGVIMTPGHAFGESGEGYFRISMSVPNERLYEAVERINKIAVSNFAFNQGGL